MAKIDVSKITGYADMSAEDKLKALEAFEFDDGATEIERYKNAVSKANSEVAEWKKKHNALLTEDEKKRLADEETLASMKKELEDLRKEKIVSEHKSQFLALGYDDVLAGETALAMAEGNLATVFANQKKFLDAHDKALQANAMKSTPTPPAGSGNGTVNYQKAIDDAYARGDMVSVATLMRQMQESISK